MARHHVLQGIYCAATRSALCVDTLHRMMLVGVFALGCLQAGAQDRTAHPLPADPQVLMLSDIHFDPFHDPAKVPLLVRAPIDQWNSILQQPESPDQAARFAAIQETCNAKEAFDTPYALLRSGLQASKEHAASAAFVTVSGDLLVHDLDCRFRAATGLPADVADDQSPSANFAEKTTVFVMRQVKSAFPHVPVYFALGNNDSRCNHNRLDSHDRYLRASADEAIGGLRGVRAIEKTTALKTFESAGYYAVTMPSPMQMTRSVVVDDVYMMPKYADCEANEQDKKGELEQTAWLEKELADARRNGQRVWVLGHLPPSVNPSASLSDKSNFCPSSKVVRFQTTDELAKQLTSYADVVKLGIFGHTHMDEFHLLRGGNFSVPIKVVSSLTPVSGNLPSFTVGIIDRTSGTLADFVVYEASNPTGIGTVWSKEYSFNDLYQEVGFSSTSLNDLITRLRADKNGTGEVSRMYKSHYLKGSGGKKLSASWPGYVCSLDNAAADGFEKCLCGKQTPRE